MITITCDHCGMQIYCVQISTVYNRENTVLSDNKIDVPTMLVLHSIEYLGRLGRFHHPLFHIQFQHGV